MDIIALLAAQSCLDAMSVLFPQLALAAFPVTIYKIPFASLAQI